MILCVDRYDDALAVLEEAGYQAVTEEVVLVRVPDRPGELARLAVRLGEEGVNLRSLRIVQREAGSGLAAIVTDDMEKTRALLSEFLVRS